MHNRLALGTVQFGLAYGVANNSGQIDPNQAGKILAEARQAGINMLDTAIAYGDSERTLGQIGVAGWRIVTKLPEMPETCSDVAEWVESQVKGSLDRLGVQQLHAVLLHRPAQLLEARGPQLFAALEHLKMLGYTKKIGISIYDPSELDSLFSKMNFDLVQAPLNILDRRLVDSGWARRLKHIGAELHVRSAFLQGLLLMSSEKRPQKFNRWQSLWLEWDRWLNEVGLSPLEACLRYTLSVEEVDSVVVGVDSVEQFREIHAAANGVLPGLPAWPHAIDPVLLNPALWSKL
ncbi:putative NAD(P)-linked oxidoreductase [Herminiimonas arsenicoxydans]|uniref:NAD(P)-linked oxidoreductase n=1 Tax=Herminiimonas arsenicoxydans TaxID=204773 RepID=A4G464_HERAR|nr:putative NAD(P)-linked oxidoreductase [Herminiimonas arsenicoxydans]